MDDKLNNLLYSANYRISAIRWREKTLVNLAIVH